MRLAAILTSSFALVLAGAWLVNSPGYDSAAACAAAVAALIPSFLLKRKEKLEGQAQQISRSSIGIQAGRDVNVRDITKD